MKKLLVTLAFVFGLFFSSTSFAANVPASALANNLENIEIQPAPEFIPIVLCYHSTTETTSPDGTVTKTTTTICLVVIL